MYCVNCGCEIRKEFKFCPKCGSSIKNDIDLYDRVKKYVIENNKVSLTLIEKEFNLKKEEASKIIDRLENDGIISKKVGRKREVLVKDVSEDFSSKVKNKIEDVMNTSDTTSEFEKKDINDSTFLAVLSYLGVFAFIPYFIKTDSKFVKYHANRGINLLIIEGVYTLLNSLLSMIKVSKVVVNYYSLVGTKMVTPFFISFPMTIIGIILALLSIIGIVNVCNGKAKELPLIGKIKIIK